MNKEQRSRAGRMVIALATMLLILLPLLARGQAIPAIPGDLLVGDASSGQVLRFDSVSGMSEGAFTGTGGIGGVNSPRGMIIGPDSRLYVSSFGNNSVLRFNGRTGAYLGVFASTGAPTGLTFGPDGNLYVSNYNSSSVWRFNGQTGAFKDIFVSSGSGGLNHPQDLAFGPDGNLYVASQGSSSILRYNGRTGASLGPFASSGGLNAPSGLLFARDGNLYVGSTGNNSILRYNGTTGAFIDTFVASGSGGLLNPQGFGFGVDGNFYVVSQGTSNVLRYNGTTGAPMGVFAASGLGSPFFLAFIPPRDSIYTDHGGNTGQVSVRITTDVDFELVAGAQVKLTPPDIAGSNVRVVNSHYMTATFDLTGISLGQRDVVITLPNNTTRTIARAFTVEQGRAPQIITQLIGRSQLRAGFFTSYYVTVQNIGNVDANFVTAYISFPKFLIGQVGEEFQSEAFLVPDDGNTIFSFDLPVIHAGEVRNIILRLEAPDNPALAHRQFQIQSWAGQIRLAINKVNSAYSYSRSNDWRHAVDLILEWTLHVSPYAIEEPAGTIAAVGLHADKLLICGMIAYIGLKLAQCRYDAAADPLLDEHADTWQARCNTLENLLTRLQTAAGCRCGGNCTEKTTEVVTSNDPNDLQGDTGIGIPRWVSGTQSLPYTIFFENLPTASAAAQVVTVTNQLDVAILDLTSLSLGPITINDKTVVPLPGVSPIQGIREYNADIDLRPAKNLVAHINARLNLDTGRLIFQFTSLDPLTGMPLDPSDPNGFLDRGQEGNISITVIPKRGLPTGTVVYNQASIVFDANPPMNTPVWFNTIDNDAPTSLVLPLAATQSSAAFVVRWQGMDIGSGERDFTIYVSDNGGAYTPWLTQVPATQTDAVFVGQPGRTYAFYSVVRDNTFNTEAAHTTADATTTIGPSARVAAVSGTVTLQSCMASAVPSQPITFEFRSVGSSPSFSQTVNLNSDGTFNLTHLPPGTYNLAIKGAKWLRKIVAIDTTQGNVSGITVTLLAGDVNNDNSITTEDYLLLKAAFGSQPGDPNWNEGADFNCDGVVTTADYLLLKANFGLRGDP